MDIIGKLKEKRDPEFAAFQAKLIPNVAPDSILGVRTPELRALAKEIDPESRKTFLRSLPHRYFEENMLHAVLISKEKTFDAALDEVGRFVRYIDNWAVCDVIRPKVFCKRPSELLEHVKDWIGSEETFVCRFGVGTLMAFFLDGEFRKELLELPLGVKNDNYYVQMMVAWFYATSLAKQWDDTIGYLTEKRLPLPIHNKTVRKACESFRIPDERKLFLKSLRTKENG